MKILLIFGTRPEAIKMAPVVHALKDAGKFEVAVCVTAQHREMLDQVLNFFKIVPEFDLDVMRPNQTLTNVTVDILNELQNVLISYAPDYVLVHGDTTTTFAVSLACFYQRVPVCHVEAGLRTGNMYSPWPEEGNRRLTTAISKLHFAPTNTSRLNLLNEGISEESIVVTGNTVIDALLLARDRIDRDSKLSDSLAADFAFLNEEKRLILVTVHRRENLNENIEFICDAIRQVSSERHDVEFVCPVHLNPRVQRVFREKLGKLPNVHLIAPQEYVQFVYLMSRATFLLSDSGGIQEEAPALGKPVLVLRDTTERPEAVTAGTVKLVGSESAAVQAAIERLLDDPREYQRMASAKNPYGDGTAAIAIREKFEGMV